jgi:rifampicin phosphotransferase
MSRFILPLASPAARDPERVGPKAANLARLAQAGLPTPRGFCITAQAYRRQLQHLGLIDVAHHYAEACALYDDAAQRRLSVEIRLALYQNELATDLRDAILTAWRNEQKKPAAVRSSALIEDRADSSFAGQFESFLGLREDGEFFTALRACWAALWTTNARRSLARHDLVPSGTAMAVLVQPLVAAHASGGGLSKTADGQMTLSATWGLGSTLAQGELVPDRIVLSRAGFVRKNEPGRKHHREACAHRAGTMTQAVPDEMARAPCLQAGQATALGRLMRRAEDVLGQPVEIEWALDDEGF